VSDVHIHAHPRRGKWVLLALLAGIATGFALAFGLFSYEPSAEYEQTMVRLEEERDSLEAELVRLGADLRVMVAAEAHARVRLEQTDSLLLAAHDRTAELRTAARAADARLLGLRNSHADSLQIIEAEHEAQLAHFQAAASARGECNLCNRELAEAKEDIRELRGIVRTLEAKVSTTEAERDSYREALGTARGEVDRASGSLGRPEWWHPTITMGPGCSGGIGFGCGLSVTAGLDVSSLLRR